MEWGSNFSLQNLAWARKYGMTIKMSDCGIAASSQDIRTMIEAVHVLDRQAGSIQ